MHTEFLAPSAQLSGTDWERIHQGIQARLAQLEESVRQHWAHVPSRTGRTAANAWLFSYREFSCPDDPEAEDVVAGILFELSQDGQEMVIRGDISGGETGHTYYQVEEYRTADRLPAVEAAAQEVAHRLQAQAAVVVNALHEHRRPPDYRGRPQ